MVKNNFISRKKQYSFLFAFTLTIGCLLWFINWYSCRPLFIDEANIARNLFDRNFTELFSPLDHKQYAPPLYLIIAKACGELLGYGEMSLRFPSLLGGFLAIVGIIIGGKKIGLGAWVILPLALLFVNPTALRFVGELKPYSLDLGISAILIASVLSSPKPTWRWAIGGTIIIWCSLPSVFVLASTSLYSTLTSNKKDKSTWLLIIACWLCSFSILYFAILRPSVGSNYLNDFHNTYFFPIPTTEGFDFKKSITILLAQPRLAFGFTAFAIFWGSLISLVAIIKTPRQLSFLLISPLLIVILVSTTKHYSLIPRLMLFTLPGWWLLSALGTKILYEKLGQKTIYKYSILFSWLVLVGGTNVARHLYEPLLFSDSRKLTTQIDSGYVHILHKSAVPAYDYYNRIHSQTPYSDSTAIEEGNLQHQDPPGKYVVLYDVTTQNSINKKAFRDSLWAVEQGAAEIRIRKLFRAKSLYVKLTEK